MAAPYFLFKNFVVAQQQCAMKVTADAVMFGAWVPLPEGVRRILDVGCGTGLLSLMLAQRFSDIHIDAVELEEAAAKQASENVANSRYKNRIRVVQADVRNFEPAASYDFIICNPPFYTNAPQAAAEKKKMAWHDTHLSLSDVAVLGQKLLSENGSMAILLPLPGFEMLQTVFNPHWHLQKILYVNSPGKSSKNRTMSLWGKEAVTPMEETIYLGAGGLLGNKTAQQLLSPFYLFL